MFSLLGFTTVRALKAELWAKQVHVVTLAGVSVCLVGCIALIPAYVDSDGVTFWSWGGDPEIDALAQDLLPDAEDTDGLVKEENAKQLLVLAREQSQLMVVTPVLAHMREVAMRHGDIHLVRIALSQGVFIVTGVAQSRESLLTLRADYRKETTWFTNADIPIVQLSGKDGEFPFTITVVPVGTKKDDTKKL